MKKQLLSLLAIALIPASIMAIDTPEESASDTFHGNVPAVNRIDIVHTLLGQNDRLEDLGSKQLVNKEILQYTVSNNDPAGFTISFESANKGKMIRKGGGSVNTGDFLDYTVSTAEMNNESVAKFLGANEPEQLAQTSLKNKQALAYDNGLVKSTVDYTYKLGVHTEVKPELFRGMYQDTITITIADNS